MTVTGAEWRDLDPHDPHLPDTQHHRHPPKPSHPEEEDDIVEIQGDPGEEQADGLDAVE